MKKMAQFSSTLLGLLVLAIWSTCQATCSVADLTLDEQLDEIQSRTGDKTIEMNGPPSNNGPTPLRQLPIQDTQLEQQETGDRTNEMNGPPSGNGPTPLRQLPTKESQLDQQDYSDAHLSQLKAKMDRMDELEIKIQKLESILIEKENRANRQLAPSFRQVVNPGAPRIPRSCADLKCMGQNASGIYTIIGVSSAELVFCDFTKLFTDPGYQTWIGFVDAKSIPTYFYVQKNGTFNIPTTPIQFDLETVNIGKAYDPISGKFTAPVPGRYFFSFVGLAGFPAPPVNTTAYHIIFDVVLYKNGLTVGRGWSDEITTGQQWDTNSIQSTLNLMKGDQVWVEIYRISLDVQMFGYRYTHFNGFLLEEDFAQSVKPLP